MATKPRERSSSGFYHVFQRGVNQFDIFEDDVDRSFYLDRLKKYSAEIGVEVHAWCLMSNHTHLLLKASHESLSALMRIIGSVYAKFFNCRHSRSGPLFEGRFCSVCIESDAQFMSVVRYIHRNPVHHDESALFGTYSWSSYGEYLTASPSLCVLDLALSLFGSIGELARFHRDWDGRERHLDIDTRGRMGDDEARTRANVALKDVGIDVPVSSIGTLRRQLRDKAIKHVKRAVGCSLRQIQRLTSIAYSAIQKAIAVGELPGGGTMSKGQVESLGDAPIHDDLLLRGKDLKSVYPGDLQPFTTDCAVGV